MKTKVLTEVQVICEPPHGTTYWARTEERKAELLEQWAKEFNEFIRDHRSQDGMHLSVQRVYEDRCSHCEYLWEMDADGPVCCQKAQEEWAITKARAP